MTHTYDYPRPAVTVDVALFGRDPAGNLRVLLIRRKNEPFRGMWALPGGFLDMDEELDAGAARELLEETGVSWPAQDLQQVGAYGAIGRDPRGRSVGVAYFAFVSGELPEARAADDAEEASWELAGEPRELAFDHAAMLLDALRFLDGDAG